MKRFLALFLAILMVFGTLVACGDDKETESESESEEEYEETEDSENEDDSTEDVTGDSTDDDDSQDGEHKHTFSEWEIEKKETCEADGLKKRICTTCGTAQTEVIKSEGHVFGDPIVISAPTCEADGENNKVCKVCAYEEKEIVPATGHKYVNYVCSVCKGVAAEKSVQTVKIANSSLLIPLDKSVKLDVQIYPADAIYEKITFTIDDRNNANTCGATITEDGVLTATKLGSVKVRVTVDNVSSAFVTFNVPTEIHTAEEFNAIRNNLKGYYILCNDIDLSEYSEWVPIGYATKLADGRLSYSETGFKGEFNGNGYTIKGLNINLNKTNLATVGLFGFVDTSAVVSNLKLEAKISGTGSDSDYVGALTGVNYGIIDACDVSAEINSEGGLYLGGITGQNTGNLTNSAVDVTIKGSNSNTDGFFVGGVVGQNSGSLNGNEVVADIDITSCKYCYVGGITGNSINSFKVVKCDANITVSAETSSYELKSYVGGVVGKVEYANNDVLFDLDKADIKGSITVTKADMLYAGGIAGYGDNFKNCSSNVAIDVKSVYDVAYIGGIAGYGDTFDNCKNDISISVKTSDENSYIGGIAGKATSVKNSVNNASILLTSSGLSYIGGIVGNATSAENVTNYGNVAAANSSAYIGGVAGEVSTAKNVYNYANELSLKASSSIYAGGVIGSCSTSVDNSYNTAEVILTGSSSSTLYAGGIVGDASTSGNSIKGVSNNGKMSVTLSSMNSAYIGGVAGKAASVADSMNLAFAIDIKVGGLDSSNSLYTGGLCGYVSSLIDNSYSNATVTVEKTTTTKHENYEVYAGGLVGGAENISKSYAIGDLNVNLYNDKVFAGGLAAYLFGNASESYAYGSVNGVATHKINIGGLIALVESGATVTSCYAAYNELKANISVDGNIAYIGGLVAYNEGTISDSYTMNFINDVVGKGTEDYVYAGGVIGYNDGKVSKCYSLSATDYGIKELSFDIDCTSNLSANVYVGGFVGYNNNSITDCYSRANVVGRAAYVAGFVGHQSSTGRVSNSLAFSSVNHGISENATTGGFSGNKLGGYTNCIFSTTSTGIVAGNGAGGETVEGISGKTEVEIIGTSVLTAFDKTIWTIANGSMPVLTLDDKWGVYNDTLFNYNVLKNVVKPERQYVDITPSLVEVKFETDLGFDMPDTLTLEKNTKLPKLPILEFDGYGFFGWYLDADYTKIFEVKDVYTVTESMTLYPYLLKAIDIPKVEDFTYDGEEVTLKSVSTDGTCYTVSGTTTATEAGEYTVTLTPNKNYAWSDGTRDAITITWVIKRKAIDIPKPQNYMYSGDEYILKGVDTTGVYYTIKGAASAVEAGEYKVTLSLTGNYCWSDETTDDLTLTWVIRPNWVRIPLGQTYTYNGEEITLSTIDTTGAYYTVSGTATATDAGEYTVTLTPTNNYTWSDGTVTPVSITWEIKPAKVAIPGMKTYYYDGQEKSLTTIDEKETYYTIKGITKATAAGEYTVTLTPNKNSAWSDGTTDPVTITWEIKTTTVSIPGTETYYYEADLERTLRTISTDGIYYTVKGTYKATDAGEYTVTLTLNDSCIWSDGTTEQKTITWKIIRKPISNPNVGTTEFTYDGSKHGISVDVESKYYTVDGTYNATDAGDYAVTLKLKDNYCWSDGSTDPKTYEWKIKPYSISYPTVYNNTEFSYSEGSAYSVFRSYDETGKYYTIVGTYEATEAGTYTVTVTPTNNYCWSGGSKEPKTYEWKINRKPLEELNIVTEYTYTGEECVIAIDPESTYYTVDGTYKATEIGEYTVTLKLNSNYCWSDRSIEDKVITWKINPVSL